MAEAKLYGQSKKDASIRGILKEYYAAAHENISPGDLVEFVNGIAHKTQKTSTYKQLSTETYTGYAVSAVQLDDNRVFIAHSYGSNYYLYGMIVSLDGTTINTGVDTALVSSVNAGAVISSIRLGNNKVLISHSYGTDKGFYALVIETEGMTIKTKGTDTVISTLANDGECISSCLLPSGKVFVAHTDYTYRELTSVIFTIDGLTITVGTHVSLATKDSSGAIISVALLENGNVFVAHSYNTNYYLYGIVCTINNTTISKGTDTVLINQTYTAQRISTAVLSANKVFIVHSRTSTNYLYGIICTISGTSISIGNDTELYGTYSHGRYCAVTALSSTLVFISHSYYGNLYNTYELTGMTATISGTTITIIDHKDLLDSGVTQTQLPLLLNNGAIFLVYNIDNSKYYLQAQIWNVDRTTNKITNTIEESVYETQIRKTTSNKFEGIAKTSGIGGDEMGHNDLVEVYQHVNSFNLIPDYSFEKDLWPGANYSESQSHSKNRSLYFPTNTTYVPTIEIPRPIIGHKYYGRRYIKTNGNNTPADCRFEVWGADGANKNWVYAWNQGDYPTWHFDSDIHEITGIDYPTTDRTIVRCFNVNTTADTWVDDVLLIDLTDIFGAGKEPTKDWCDKNL